MKMRKLAYMFCAIAAALGAFVAMARFVNVAVDLRFDPPEIETATFHSLAGDPFWAASVKIERSEVAPVAADSPRLATPGMATGEVLTAPSPLKYERQPNALAPTPATVTAPVAAELPHPG